MCKMTQNSLGFLNIQIQAHTRKHILAPVTRGVLVDTYILIRVTPGVNIDSCFYLSLIAQHFGTLLQL